MSTVGLDGEDEQPLRYGVAGIHRWQPGPPLHDGRRMIMIGWEDGKIHLGGVRSHQFLCDLTTGTMEREILTTNRLAPHYAPVAVMPGDERLLVNVILKGDSLLYDVKLDGSDARPAPTPKPGFSYGFSLSADGRWLAYHTTGPNRRPYRIYTQQIDGSQQQCIAEKAGHLYFGPVWSPDGQWLLYADCIPATDPGHDWADLVVSKPDGSEHRGVTTGQALWFASSYGVAGNHGSGSIIPEWSSDGRSILVNRRIPGSKVPWEFQPNRPDTDHFNRDFKPEAARGGTHICLIDPRSGRVRELTPAREGLWEWGPHFTPDGKRIVFHRAAAGELPSIWVMNANGSGQRRVTRGTDNQGAIFSRWM